MQRSLSILNFHSQTYITYNQPLIDIPNPEDKLCCEKGCHLIELFPAVTGVMLFLWDPIKAKMMTKFQDFFLGQFQIISE